MNGLLSRKQTDKQITCGCSLFRTARAQTSDHVGRIRQVSIALHAGAASLVSPSLVTARESPDRTPSKGQRTIVGEELYRICAASGVPDAAANAATNGEQQQTGRFRDNKCITRNSTGQFQNDLAVRIVRNLRWLVQNLRQRPLRIGEHNLGYHRPRKWLRNRCRRTTTGGQTWQWARSSRAIRQQLAVSDARTTIARIRESQWRGSEIDWPIENPWLEIRNAKIEILNKTNPGTHEQDCCRVPRSFFIAVMRFLNLFWIAISGFRICLSRSSARPDGKVRTTALV